MRNPIELLGLYLRLAAASERRLRPQVTDRLLILIGAMAAELNLPVVAAGCRDRILKHNPQHLIKNYATFEDASSNVDFETFIKQLWRRYSAETVERHIQELEIETGNERQAYFSDEEYALSLLSTVRQIRA